MWLRVYLIKDEWEKSNNILLMILENSGEISLLKSLKKSIFNRKTTNENYTIYAYFIEQY